MQIFEQKYITKNDISLYSTKYDISKNAFLLLTRSVARGRGILVVHVRRGAHRHVTRTLYYYSVNGAITNRASESVKKRTYNLPSLTYARKADISNTNTCGSTLNESTASIFWYNTTSS